MQTSENGKKSFLNRYKTLPRNVYALSVVSLLNDTSSEIIYPLLPVFLALTLGASPFAVGAIEGAAESVASILKLFAGYLSDRFRTRKLPVFAGYALASVVRPLLAFVTNWTQVLGVRLVDRVGKGIRGAPRDALLAAEVPPEKRGLAFGFNRAADHLGAVIGPLIAFVMLSYMAQDPAVPTADEYRQVFLFASVPVVFGLLIIIFFVKETGQAEMHEAAEKSRIKFSLAEFDGNFKKLLVTIAIFTLSNSTDAFLLLRAREAGVAAAVLPLLWMVLHFSKVVSSLVGGELADKFSRKSLIFAGWILYALVYVAFAFIDQSWQAWTMFIVYGFYFGLTEGAEKALIADMVPREKRGTAFGLYALAVGITVFPASLLLGAIWSSLGATIAFIFSAALSVVAAILLLILVKPPEQGSRQ